MKRFREIRIREVNEAKVDKKPEELGYLKIEPETDISYEEACAFWDAIFGDSSDNNK